MILNLECLIQSACSDPLLKKPKLLAAEAPFANTGMTPLSEKQLLMCCLSVLSGLAAAARSDGSTLCRTFFAGLSKRHGRIKFFGAYLIVIGELLLVFKIPSCDCSGIASAFTSSASQRAAMLFSRLNFDRDTRVNRMSADEYSIVF